MRRVPAQSLWVVMLTALMTAPAAAAQVGASELATATDDSEGDWDDDGGDWDDEGFADMPLKATPSTAAAATTTSPWTAAGFARSDWALWTERLSDNPFAKGRQSVDLKLEFKQGIWRATVATHVDRDLAYDHERSGYDMPTLRAYESLFQLRDAFVAAALGDLEFTLGRQIVAWGEGDAISPLDVVNPRDLREPGLSDLDDIRIPVLASRAGWFRGAHRVEAMVVHEASFGLRGPPRGPFSPLPWLIHNSPALGTFQKALPHIPIAERFDAIPLDWEHKQERWSADLQQAYLRWVHKGEGLDLGLYVASVLDQQGVMTVSEAQNGLMMDAIINNKPEPLTLTLDHRRYEVVGTSGATTWSDLLVKWELVYNIRHPYNAGDFPQVYVIRSDVVSGMLGLTWRGVDDTTIAVEASKNYLLDKPDALLFPIDAPVLMLRVMHQSMREDLTLLLAASAMGLQAEYGWLLRAEANYKMVEAVKLAVGYVTYQPTDEFGPFAGLNSHDRLFMRLRWDFAAR